MFAILGWVRKRVPRRLLNTASHGLGCDRRKKGKNSTEGRTCRKISYQEAQMWSPSMKGTFGLEDDPGEGREKTRLCSRGETVRQRAQRTGKSKKEVWGLSQFFSSGGKKGSGRPFSLLKGEEEQEEKRGVAVTFVKLKKVGETAIKPQGGREKRRHPKKRKE